MPITESVAFTDNNYYYNAGVGKSLAQPKRGPIKKISQAELEAANGDDARNVNEEILDEGDFHYG